MPAEPPDRVGDPVDLLHRFYLDTDTSMAVAAALAGGLHGELRRQSRRFRCPAATDIFRT
jgi:hypothetical protein